MAGWFWFSFVVYCGRKIWGAFRGSQLVTLVSLAPDMAFAGSGQAFPCPPSAVFLPCRRPDPSLGRTVWTVVQILRGSDQLCLGSHLNCLQVTLSGLYSTHPVSPCLGSGGPWRPLALTLHCCFPAGQLGELLGSQPSWCEAGRGRTSSLLWFL